ncbi:MAG: M23 family metallopeptidase [Bacteroidota bacterium]
MSRLNKVLAITCLLQAVAFLAWSQSPSPESGEGGKEEDYYLFPVRPGQSSTLSGTMGEIRSNHFHSGIDVRTGGQIGLPIYAAADGYVSRVAVKTGGYGKAIYLAHPNGQTTVYAHLDRFNGPIALHVLNHQYVHKKFSVNIFPKKGQFPIKKGDIIAYGGNSGSSSGPHLHFEIRNANQEALDPLEYNFEEIKDTTPPKPLTIAFKTFDKNARINEQFGRFEYDLNGRNGKYSLKDTVYVYGEIGTEILAYDYLDGTRFKCGIKQIDFTLNGESVFKQRIEKIKFSEQRYILKHYDHQIKLARGDEYNKLYVDDGNKLRFYKTNALKGKFRFNEDCVYNGLVKLQDTKGNVSEVSFVLKCQPPTNGAKVNSVPHVNTYEVLDNTLIVYGKSETPVGSDSLYLFKGGKKKLLTPAYTSKSGTPVYLWDLKTSLPDSVTFCEQSLDFHFKDVVPTATAYSHYNEHLDLYFPKAALFDTLYLDHHYEYDSAKALEKFTISNKNKPLFRPITIKLKPKQTATNLRKASAYRIDAKGNRWYEGGKWNNGKMEFNTRTFGTYAILVDSLAPKINPVQITSSRIVFKTWDYMSGIKDINLYVDGEWILMDYDYKTRTIRSQKLNESKPFKGQVKLSVVDNVGNINHYETQIN